MKVLGWIRNVCRRVIGRKRLWWFGVTFLALEAFYLVAGNIFLNFGLAPLASMSPETVRMEIEGAFTLWPTTAHVRRYRLRAQDSVIQWSLEVEDADLTVDLLDLLHKKFHATRIRAKECSFRLRRKLDDESVHEQRVVALPPIPGWAAPPMKEIGPPGPPTTEANYNLWTAQLQDVVTGITEIWIDEFRVVGKGRVAGSFFFKPLRLLQIGPVRLDVHDGELRMGDGAALRGMDLHVDSTVGLVHIGEPVVRAVREISMSAQIDAELASVDFMRLYLSSRSPFELAEGGGAVQFDVRLANGVALPPTRFRVESDRLLIVRDGVLSVLDVAAEARVVNSAKGPTANGELRVRHAALIRPDNEAAPPVIDATARLRGLPRDLAGPIAIKQTHLEVAAKAPDLAILRSPPERRTDGDTVLGGRASLTGELDLDEAFRGAGRLEAHADRVHASTSAIEAAARMSVKLGFDHADLRQKNLRLLPSYVTADDVTVTREGRAHRGGAVRVDVSQGSVQAGVPRDVELALAARFPDLGWLAFHGKGDESGASAIKGAVDAKLTVSRPASMLDASGDAGVTGSIGVTASAEGHLRDVAMRGNVSATALIDRLDVARRALVLRDTHVEARDVEIRRGDDRTSGWWASLDASPLEGKATGDASLAAHVTMRCQSGKPFLAVLASNGTIPAWIGSIFPMYSLYATADVRQLRGKLDVGLAVDSTSARVQARLDDLGGKMNGAVLVHTAVVSLGVRLAHGESHVKVFAGQDWLKGQLAEVAAEEKSRAATSVSASPGAR